MFPGVFGVGKAAFDCGKSTRCNLRLFGVYFTCLQLPSTCTFWPLCTILRAISLVALLISSAASHSRILTRKIGIGPDQIFLTRQEFIFCALLVADLRGIQAASWVPNQPFASSRLSVSCCLNPNYFLAIHAVSKTSVGIDQLLCFSGLMV